MQMANTLSYYITFKRNPTIKNVILIASNEEYHRSIIESIRYVLVESNIVINEIIYLLNNTVNEMDIMVDSIKNSLTSSIKFRFYDRPILDSICRQTFC